MIRPEIPARATARLATPIGLGVALAALAACGGGVVPDPGGTSAAVRLTCPSTCVASNTLDTSRITAYLYVVDDGSRTQAQAGFNTDGSLLHNVELDGDTLWLVDGSQQTRMLLARQGAWDFLLNLLTLGQPYLGDLSPQPTTARTYRFELRRATGTVASTVALPAPFELGAPAEGQAFSLGASGVDITVTSPLDTGNFATTFTCSDANGNQTSNRVPDGLSFSATDATGQAFRFNVPAFLASLEWDQDGFPAAPVTRCDVTLRVVASNAGTLDNRFHAFSVLQATQIRTRQIVLR